MAEWNVMSNYVTGEIMYQVWRQTRPLRPGEPMNSGARETRGPLFLTKEKAQEYANELNGGA